MSVTESVRAQFDKALIGKSVEQVQMALDAGLPINELWDDEAPLHRATGITYAHLPIVELLLSRGADPNLTQEGSANPIMKGRTALMLAACFGHKDIADRLLKAGADVHARMANGMGVLGWCNDRSAEKIFKALSAAGSVPSKEDAFLIAANGSSRMLESIPPSGFDPNEFVPRFGLALHSTVVYNNLKNAQLLLRRGADPALKAPAATDHVYMGETPLDVASRLKNKTFIALLSAALRGILPEPAKPKVVTAADLPQIWKELERVLKANRPDVRSTLNRGASPAALDKLEKAIGTKLPAEVADSMRTHNGQKDGAEGVFPDGVFDLPGEFVLMSIDECLAEWKLWNKLAGEGEFAGLAVEPDPGVAADWWNRQWIPIASNGGGDSLCIDLAPDAGGVIGQVILVAHDLPARRVLAGSWTMLLSMLISELG